MLLITNALMLWLLIDLLRMMQMEIENQARNRLNNFGFLRLLFAYLVIFGRSPEMLDGNVNREILYLATGTISFGDLAVDGFFLISGYLICQSFEHSKSFLNYLYKRVLRIYPAFIVVWLLTLLVLVPLTGGIQEILNLTIFDWLKNSIKMIFLSEPFVDGHLILENSQTLNGALWTIRYEFLCYLFIPLLALFALNKRSVISLIILFLLAKVTIAYTGYDYQTTVPFSVLLSQVLRLGFAFLVGMAFYQFRDKVVWDMKLVFTSLLLLLLTIRFQVVAESALIVFGGYLMFYFAFAFKNNVIQNINVKNDISYGVYIYAWPVQALLIRSYSDINPWVLAILSAIIVTPLGFLSWRLVEKPFLKLKNKI